MSDNVIKFDRAEALVSANKLTEAAKLYRQILAEKPKHLAAARALAELIETGETPGDASAARKKAIEIEIESAYSVAKTAQSNGRFDVAIRCYRKILELDPKHGDAVWGLAEVSYGNDQPEEALRWYQRYAELFPNDPEAAHMVAALGTGPKPARASDDYVRETFDQFAEDFDRQLLEDLEYKAPKLIHALFCALPRGRTFGLDILDAGCGTGLLGIEFKPYASSLTGVDLSSEMLRRAKDRRIYDVLVEMELVAFMCGRIAMFDLIVAADVFCYIGDLTETLHAASIALKPGGCLLFTVEAQSKRGYTLTGSGRYAHKPAYIRKVAQNAGLKEILARTESLRLEYGEPVKGYITALQKPN